MIVLDVQQMKEEGKPLTEIREYIDEKYSQYGTDPTPTPLPPEGL